ncbi:MAG: sugar phosphate isomerase/epimerase [Planctomycetes bacterium]|nr:sugar phosphate isomerase/epimerase [Planctomycetota bacterium]
MKFAICNETFVDWPFEKAFATARECGYTGIEIAPFTIAADAKDISAQARQQIRRQAAEADLEVVGLHWLLAKTEGYYLTSPDAEVRQRTAEYIGELARLCRDLGGKLLVFGSPQQRNLLPGTSLAEATNYAAEVIGRSVETLQETGVTLAVEPLGPAEGDFLNTAAEGVALVEQIGSPMVRLHLDVKAMSTEAIPVADVIRANAAHLVHFHANDPNKLGPGMGEVDFVPIFAALKEIDYQGWVSVEVFDYDLGAEHIAKESMANMLTCLEKIGAW